MNPGPPLIGSEGHLLSSVVDPGTVYGCPAEIVKTELSFHLETKILSQDLAQFPLPPHRPTDPGDAVWERCSRTCGWILDSCHMGPMGSNKANEWSTS